MTPDTRASIRNSIKAGLWTALWVFIGLFLLSAIGWLGDLAEWASSSGSEPLPSISTLGYAAVSAIVAALIGLLNVIVRVAQAIGALPGSPPQYGSTTPPPA